MARFGLGSKPQKSTAELTPSQRVESALDIFTQAQSNLKETLNDFNNEATILEAQLGAIKESADRIESVLGKIGNLLD